MTAEAGLQPSRNLAPTKTKMKLVGRRLEDTTHIRAQNGEKRYENATRSVPKRRLRNPSKDL